VQRRDSFRHTFFSIISPEQRNINNKIIGTFDPEIATRLWISFKQIDDLAGQMTKRTVL
jgi:hypothetical protein